MNLLDGMSLAELKAEKVAAEKRLNAITIALENRRFILFLKAAKEQQDEYREVRRLLITAVAEGNKEESSKLMGRSKAAVKSTLAIAADFQITAEVAESWLVS